MLTSTLRRSRGIAPVVVVAALALAGCGGGDDDTANDDGVASLDDEPDEPDDTTVATGPDTTEPVDMEEAMLDFAACMREHGVDMPDPQVDEDGGVTMQMGAGPGDGPSADTDEAFEACRELMPRGPVTRNGDDFDPTEMQDELLEFAQCMRDHGVDMPDPDFDDEGRLEERTIDVEGNDGSVPSGPVLFGPFGELDLSDPATADAFEICSEGTMFAGPPGGGPAVPVAPAEGGE